MKRFFSIELVLVILLSVGFQPSLSAAPDLRGFDGGSDDFDIKNSGQIRTWGDLVEVRFAVINSGNSSAGASSVKLFVSHDLSFGDAGDYAFATVLLPILEPGYYASTQGYINVPLPNSNPLDGSPNQVYIGMVVDFDNVIAESNESNNRNQGWGKDFDGAVMTINDPVPDIQIVDSVTPTDDLVVNFGNVVDDGAGNSRGVQTLTLSNVGKAVLTVNSATVTGGSGQFRIVDSVSSIESSHPLDDLPDVVATQATESWIITLEYDPETVGAASATLNITSDDPDEASVSIALQGVGTPIPDIEIVDATPPLADLREDFDGVLNDGAGGAVAERILKVKNTGSGDLMVSQDGIALASGVAYSVESIISSTEGAIDLSTGSATLSSEGVEEWDVLVSFDPHVLGQIDDALTISSDDPDEALVTVSLTGVGLSPMDIAVTDSFEPVDDLAVTFADTHADGNGKQSSTATVSLSNIGEAPLTIVQDGISLESETHYTILSIESDQQGTVDLSAGAVVLAPLEGEVWIVTLEFDPVSPGLQTTNLEIQSDDPDEAVVTVSLTGTGLDEPDLIVTDSVEPPQDNEIGFGYVLNDGSAASIKQETIELKNIGAQPLVFDQNGISLVSGAPFEIIGISSSLDGPVDIAATDPIDRTIDAAEVEVWTVTIAFDPTANIPSQDHLHLQSNDPQNSLLDIQLDGTGEQPQISALLDQLTGETNISAATVFKVTWNDVYEAGNAVIDLFVDEDTDPSEGLVQIASGLEEDDVSNTFDWQPDASLVGGAYYLYATISDGGITSAAYSAHPVKIDPQGSFVLRSAVKTTSEDYAYEFEYLGKIYTGTVSLSPGENVLFITIPVTEEENATFQLSLEKVESLLEVQARKYDTLSRVEEVTNGNGITTVLTYDNMGRLVKRESDNGNLVEFAYDPAGRRTKMVDSTGTTFYGYDDLGRLDYITYSENGIKGDLDDLLLDYGYDLDNRLTTLIYPGGEHIEYGYDDANRLKTVHNLTHSQLTTYYYDLDDPADPDDPVTGQLDSVERPNGVTSYYDYDPLGRLDYIRHEHSGTLIAEYDYDLDATGNAQYLTITLPGGVVRKEKYVYDDFYRIKEVTYSSDATLDPNDRIVTYGYDDNGNRLSMITQEDGVVVEQRYYDYGNENRLLRVEDETAELVAEYKYDAAGNRTQKITPEGTTYYSYDERNLLLTIITPDSHTRFEYNGDGHRVAKSEDGSLTSLIVDPNRQHAVVLQTRRNGVVVSANTYGIETISIHSDGDTVYLLPDRLGSMRTTCTSDGVVLSTQSFDVFGLPQSY